MQCQRPPPCSGCTDQKFYRFQYSRKFADLLPFCVCFL
ncbi:hypothetical protein FAEPRAM212_00486 [Faecalibacterium prausnitzii M21/2]|uniref:Uncharacterized protein n=1 Tax=Faecalibacterium prausnitzii M21/2 TaxID=411485 RepID=A8S7J0_9FIRM|nr:hypothetical protein FAEPRAM212_00486 [Faecalibacterium prausnitzii M21/2]